MNYDTFIDGLKERGFVNTDKIGSIGYCNKDEKHYLTYTDGLVIYFTIPNFNAVEELQKHKFNCHTWHTNLSNFNFKFLDRELN
jgi:hypothetical protein